MALKIQRILNRGLVAGVIVVALSFLLPLVPCTKAPVVEAPEYSFGMCKLPNPFAEEVVGISQKYYTINTDPMAGLIIQFIVVAAIFIIIFLFFRRKTKKVLDLTNK